MTAARAIDVFTAATLILDCVVLAWVWINRDKWREVLTERHVERTKTAQPDEGTETQGERHAKT